MCALVEDFLHFGKALQPVRIRRRERDKCDGIVCKLLLLSAAGKVHFLSFCLGTGFRLVWELGVCLLRKLLDVCLR